MYVYIIYIHVHAYMHAHMLRESDAHDLQAHDGVTCDCTHFRSIILLHIAYIYACEMLTCIHVGTPQRSLYCWRLRAS